MCIRDRYILQSSKNIWAKGHLLLSQIASNSYGMLKNDETLKDLFKDGYYAESKWTWSRDISYSDWYSTKTQNFIRSKTEKEKKSKKLLPAYFCSFGVESALDRYIKNKKNAEKRIKNKKTKDLTPKEQKCINFLFDADFSKITISVIIAAMGQAFFTLSIGMGAIMAYGAYMPQDASIGKTVMTVAFFDSLVAIVSGLIIFSIVFSTAGLEPTAGPGLMFISLPIAFGNMSAGLFIGALFFILVSIAAWSSAISLLEPSVAWLMEERNMGRVQANISIVVIAWILGIGSVLSFNYWQEYKLLGFTYFDFLDFLTSNILLPLTGLLIAVFVGYIISPRIIDSQMNSNTRWKSSWITLLKFVAPIAILIVFAAGIVDKFGNLS